MFGRRHPLVDITHLNDATIPISFDSVTQAKSYLDILTSGIFRLQGALMAIAENAASTSGKLPADPTQRRCYIQALSRSVDLAAYRRQVHLRKQSLKTGLAAFWNAMEAFTRLYEKSSDRAVMAIHIQYLLVLFTLTTCRNVYEMACDDFNDLFQDTITLAERYIHSSPCFADSSRKRTLSLETGVIPTIILVATKCRKPETRSRAIRLLREACMQEAIWDGTPFAIFLQRQSELELDRSCVEWSCVESSTINPNVTVIPEHARYIDVVVADEIDEHGRGRLVCARYRHESNGRIELSEHKIHLSP